MQAAVDIAYLLGDHERCETEGRKWLRLCQRCGFEKGEAQSLALLGRLARMIGKYAEARSLLEEALARYHDVGDQRDILSMRTIWLASWKSRGSMPKQVLSTKKVILARERRDDIGVA